jgi:hypothetical protein
MAMRAVPALLGIALAGCGPNMEEAIATHGAKVEQKLAAVGRVGAVLPATPVLDHDGVEGSPRVVVKKGIDPEPGGNAAVIYVEDLRDLTELSLVYARMEPARLVPNCAALVRTHREPWDAKSPSQTPPSGWGYTASKRFEACSTLEYLLVIRTLAFAKPSSPSSPSGVTADAGGATDAGSEATSVFYGGYGKAEVLVFALDGPRLLGGFRFEAESSEKLGDTGELTLEADFERQWKAAFTAAASRTLPNGKFEL